MASGLITKYVWIVDTILSHRAITRNEINELWMRNLSISDGNPLPRRTFNNYLNRIEDTFDIKINCNKSTYEYSIDVQCGEKDTLISNWLLDSIAVNNALTNSRDISSRIMLEDVPSARLFLPIVVSSLKENKRIKFNYHAFDRSMVSTITLDPYFMRIFRQRWYVIGYEKSKKDVRTYSLDRMQDLQLLSETFLPPDIDASEYFKNCFGIYYDKSEPQNIKLKVSYDQAKYFRALPLHHSQQEEVHDKYSIFEYHMFPTYDFIQEILSHGDKIEVMAPPTLRVRLSDTLKKALKNYEQ